MGAGERQAETVGGGGREVRDPAQCECRLHVAEPVAGDDGPENRTCREQLADNLVPVYQDEVQARKSVEECPPSLGDILQERPLVCP